MVEYEEKEGLSVEKVEENKEKTENEKVEVIPEVKSVDVVEKSELKKEEEKIQPTVQSAEELPPYTPGMAKKGMAVKKVDPTQKVEPTPEKEEKVEVWALA